MAVDPRKRQKKLQRRNAKQKAERRESARRNSQGLAFRLQQASSAPILHCCMMADLLSQGIGQVLVSRAIKDGTVAFAAFLIDVYCLGAKNAMANIIPRAQYDRAIYGKMASLYELTQLRPECARKLVEGAVQYAHDLGFPPHPDYHVAKPIFGDISAEACTETFTFGKNGKPFFIGGPYDDEARCEEILRTLTQAVGPDGHRYIVPVGEPMPPDDWDVDEL